MNFIKILLFALLASILFFVYLEYEKTNTSVMLSQSSMQHRPTDTHVIYREGKRIKISNEEYAKLRAIPSIGKKLHLHNDSKETTKITNIKTLKLKGTIPQGVSYKIKVFYESDSKSSFCGSTAFSLGIFGGKSGFYLTESTKKLTYSPIIKDGHHSIEIPLDEFHPFIGCSYHLNFIQMEITNSNLQKYNVNYGGYFGLFFPKEKYSSHVTSGEPYNRHTGQTLNIECTAKDFSDKISYFSPNCHLKSTIHTFFIEQELEYSTYELNINSSTQNEYELKRFLQNKDYTSRVRFMERISKIPKIYEQNLSYFTQKIEQLDSYHKRVDNYLNEIQEKLNQLLKNKRENLSEKNIKLLENRLKTLEKSIESHQKIKEIEKKLLYNLDNKSILDTLNSKIKLNKLFLNNEFYKYEMLHLINISQKDPNLIYHNLYNLREAEAKVKTSLGRDFLHCRRASTYSICNELKHITTEKKETEKKELLKNIENIEILLFLKNRRNLYYFIKEF